MSEPSETSCREPCARLLPLPMMLPLASSYKGLVIAILYGVTSASMAFANKAVLTSYSFDYPFFLVTCQMGFAIVLLETLRVSRSTSLVRFSLQRGKDFLLPSIFYAVHSVLSLSALSGMNIPMYGVIKRCSPVVILLLSSLMLKKGWPQLSIILSVSMITLGCLIAGTFHIQGMETGSLLQFVDICQVTRYSQDPLSCGLWDPETRTAT